MAKDLKSGNWFENQKDIADKVKNLDSNGDLTGNVTGDLDGSIIASGGVFIRSGSSESITIDSGDDLSMSCTAGSSTTVDGYDALVLKSTDGNVLIEPSSGLVFLRNIPTSDPNIADILWNDSGTLKISSGS